MIRQEYLDRAERIVDRCEAEDRNLNAAERAEYNGLLEQARTAPVSHPVAPADPSDGLGGGGGGIRVGAGGEVEGYSLIRAIRAAATGDWRGADLELEASDSIARRTGTAPKGIYCPLDVFLRERRTERRDLTVGTEGTDIVATEHGQVIGPLVNRTFVIQAGATVLSGLQGDVQYPRRTNTGTIAWKAEGTAVDEVTHTFDNVKLSPNLAGAYTDISRQALVQASFNAEEVLRADLSTAIGREIDRVALHGSGSGAEPQGIRGYTGVGAVECGDPDGAAPDWGDIVGLENEVATDNADLGRLAYITNTKVRSKLKRTLKFGTDNEGTVWAAGATPLNGYSAYATNQVASDLTKGGGTALSAIFFGNWQDLLIGMWGKGVDIIIDPYTGALAGTLRIVALLLADIDLRHPESFAVIDDAVTT